MAQFRLKIVVRLSALVLFGASVVLSVRHVLAEQPASNEPKTAGKRAAKDERSLQYLLQEPTRLKQDGPLRGLAFSPDGKMLAAGGGRGCQLWDLKAGKKIRQFGGDKDAIARFGFSPDGNLWTTSDKQPSTLKLWDVSTGKLQHTVDAGGTFFAFSPDGKSLATSGSNRLREVATGKLLDTLQASYQGPTWGTTRVYHGPVIFAANGKSLITVRKTVTTEPLLLKRPGAKPLEDQRTETCVTVFIWDMKSKKVIWSIPRIADQDIDSLGVSRDGTFLVTNGSRANLRFWDLERRKLLHEFPNSFYFTMSRAGRNVFPSTSCFTMSPDGRAVVVGYGKKLGVLDIVTGKEMLETKDQAAPIIALALSPDGKTLVAGSPDGTILKWQAAK